MAAYWTDCPDPLGSNCGWDCSESPIAVSVAGTRLLRLDYPGWLEGPADGSLVELMVSACDLPASSPISKVPACLTLLFSSKPQAGDFPVPDLFWAQTWLDWFGEAIRQESSSDWKRHKVMAEVPNADDAFCHRWLSLVRALCDERSLEFSALGQANQPTGYNSYLAKPRKGCCRLPSGIRHNPS